MGRFLAAGAVVAADIALAVAAGNGNRGVFGAVTLVAYVLLMWAAYQTGHVLVSRKDTVVVVGTAVAGLTIQIATRSAETPQLVVGFVVFVVLPMLVGRYLAQHRTLVATLDAHNRQLRTERALLAEREQLRERLRIARDMHDSLGRRLSLVSVRAAAVQVSGLPAAQRQAVGELADSARDAVTELYQLIGSLRGAGDDSPGVDRIDAVVAEFRSAGVDVTIDEQGDRSRLPPAVDRAAYRVVEEGLTNAAKHAAGRPVTIQLTWETDALLLTVSNPATTGGDTARGFGLAGLRERVQAAGGYLDHHKDAAGEFRLVAMLPTTVPDTSVPRPNRFRTALVGLATAGALFVLLPASLLSGVS
jgi:signal transduction histidine kinase